MRRGALIVFAGATTARVVYAQDAFEIQVYDAETAPRGQPGIELHVNQHVLDGARDETHVTLEPHLGVARWAEVGGYLQAALTTAGDLDYAGVKLRAKVRWPSRLWKQRIGLALNGELSAVPAQFEPNLWGSELRPIVDLSVGRFYASVNPILATDLAGDRVGRPQLEPAVKVALKLADGISVGAEGYGAFGPLDDLGADHVTRLLGVIDIAGARFDLDVGAGWQWGSPDHVVAKVILGLHPRS